MTINLIKRNFSAIVSLIEYSTRLVLIGKTKYYFTKLNNIFLKISESKIQVSLIDVIALE